MQPIKSDHRMLTVEYEPRYSRHYARKSKLRGSKLQFDRLAYEPAMRKAFDDRYLAVGTQPASLTELATKLLAVMDDSLIEKLPQHLRPWRNLPLAPNPEDPDFQRLQEAYVADSTAAVEQFVKVLAPNPWLAWKYVCTITREEGQCSAKVAAAKLHEYFRPTMETFDPGGPTRQLPRVLLSTDFRARISARDFTIEELEEAIRTMSNHTSAGPDGIPIEAFRCPGVREDLLRIINSLLDREDLPLDLVAGYLTPIFKRKGDATEPGNYRPVVLLTVTLKIIHKMMLLRFRKVVDPFLLHYQHAYREGLSTIMSILPLLELVERARKSKDRQLFAVFCDFTSAFSSVDRETLFHVLRGYGMPERFVAFLEKSHAQQRLQVRADGTVHGESICPDTGVMQGDTFAPYLFLLIMDQILRRLPVGVGAIYDETVVVPTNARVRYDGRQRLPALAYADDVVLMANTREDAQLLLKAFEDAALLYGLHLNTKKGKTEIMLFGTNSLADSDVEVTCSKGKVCRTHKYKYLGFWLTDAGCDASSPLPRSRKKKKNKNQAEEDGDVAECAAFGWKADFKERKRQAWGLIQKYRRVWDSGASLYAKKRLFHALIVPIFLYSSLAYPATVFVQTLLHVELNKLLRHALRTKINWQSPEDHVSTLNLYDAFPFLPPFIARHAMVQLGHWIRLGHRQDRGQPPVVAVLSGETREAFVRGKNWPPSRIFETHIGCRVEDLVECPSVKNREQWRETANRRFVSVGVTFARRVVEPRSLQGHIRDPVNWEEVHNGWVTKMDRSRLRWGSR